jgi:5'-deoxynucleotidase YfbR-like HD superfamily hydrolase
MSAGRAKKIDAREIEVNRDILRMAAMLHDAGKVAISDLILKKPARFTDEEYGIMKAHTYLGPGYLPTPVHVRRGGGRCGADPPRELDGSAIRAM